MVWLLTDNYDYNNDPWTISATSLLNSTKQIILGSRTLSKDIEHDVSDFIASRMGTALHDAIERSWSQREPVLKLLGVDPGKLDFVLEERHYRKLGKWTISGKFDGVEDGLVYDYKSTSVWAWIFGSNDEKHRQQLSIYRWLKPELITNPIGKIHFIFTDWQKSKTTFNKDYPANRIMTRETPLMSLPETEAFISRAINRIEQYKDSSQSDIPDCTDKELWRKPTVYKYYKDPNKRTRSTKNFDSPLEAHTYKNQQGGTGIVVPVVGEPVRCKYCSAFNICEQRKRYYNDDKEYIE